MTKFLFIDVETTGTDSSIHSIWSVAAMVVCETGGDWYLLDEISLAMNPRCNNIAEWNLKKGISSAYLSQFYPQEEVYPMFTDFLKKHIDTYQKQDRYIFAAYNAHFDSDFIWKWVGKNEEYYTKYFFSGHICVMSEFMSKLYQYRKVMPNFQLITICKSLDIDLKDAHSALADIQATLRVFTKLNNIKILNYV